MRRMSFQTLQIVKGLTREFYEKLYVHKFSNLNRLVPQKSLPTKLTQDAVDDPNSPITIKEVEFINSSKKTHLDLDGFTGKFYQTLQKHITPIINNCFQKMEEKTLLNSFDDASTTLIPKRGKK